MSRDQESADLLVKVLPGDREKIQSEEESHGACLKLIKAGRNENEWFFNDGYVLKTKNRDKS